jgi:hypothetical protein
MGWKSWFLPVVAAGCLLSALVGIGLFVYRFRGSPISSQIGDWASFGGYFATIFAAVTASAIILLAFEADRLQKQREDERTRADRTARDIAELRARQDRAIALHEYYLSPDFYAKVRAPAFSIGLTFAGLPDAAREAYQDAVAEGWCYDEREKQKLLARYVVHSPSDPAGMIKHHFQTPCGYPSLTEHQALTALLRFWTRVRILLGEGMIDATLVESLFRDEFRYDIKFFRVLCSYVSDKYASDKQQGKELPIRPRWVEDIKYLEGVFKL